MNLWSDFAIKFSLETSAIARGFPLQFAKSGLHTNRISNLVDTMQNLDDFIAWYRQVYKLKERESSRNSYATSVPPHLLWNIQKGNFHNPAVIMCKAQLLVLLMWLHMFWGLINKTRTHSLLEIVFSIRHDLYQGGSDLLCLIISYL